MDSHMSNSYRGSAHWQTNQAGDPCAMIVAGDAMSQLTEEEKQNGKRKLLVPSAEIQEHMKPITREDFTRLAKKAIPLSSQPETATP